MIQGIIFISLFKLAKYLEGKFNAIIVAMNSNVPKVLTTCTAMHPSPFIRFFFIGPKPFARQLILLPFHRNHFVIILHCSALVSQYIYSLLYTPWTVNLFALSTQKTIKYLSKIMLGHKKWCWIFTLELRQGLCLALFKHLSTIWNPWIIQSYHLWR